MLTIFAVCREFSGQVGVAQDNAIASWSRLSGCELILFGDEPGVAAAARRHGAHHVGDLQRNSYGTPLLSEVFARAHALASKPLMCFVNADIILFDDVLAATKIVHPARQKFLIVSSRYNCELGAALEFAPDWQQALRTRVCAEARMYPGAGTDIFIYPRGLFQAVRPFAVGRGYWDNWLMFEARRQGACLIDATEFVVTAHQDHDYVHIADMPADAAGKDADYLASSEARENLLVAGGPLRIFTVYDADEILTGEGRLVSTWRLHLLRRRARAWLRRIAWTVTPGFSQGLARWRKRVLKQA
jgi:hypothetical protein